MRTTLKIALGFLILGLVIIQPTSSFAWYGGGWHGGGWHGRGYVGVNIGWPGPYYGPYYAPYDDPYYYPTYTVVDTPSFQPAVINGTTYYVNNGVYYILTKDGYQVVTSPVGAPVVTAPVQAVTLSPQAVPVSPEGDDTYTVNIPNDKGGYNAVTIKRSGKGFLGPQGEFYNDFPRVSQLKLMYGK